MTRAKTQHGSVVCFSKGHTVEVLSDYREWTDYASRILQSHDALVAALQGCRNFLDALNADGVQVIGAPIGLQSRCETQVNRALAPFDKLFLQNRAALAAIDKTGV